MKKTIQKSKLIAVILMFAVVSIVVALAIKEAVTMNQIHKQMRDKIDSISDYRYLKLKERFKDGYTIYYSLTGYSGFYQLDFTDSLYEEFKMESWAVETTSHPVQPGWIRLFVPEFGWNPQYVDMKMGGWLLYGEPGSSITLTNSRLDPDGLGTLVLEVVDRFDEGTVFLIAQPHPNKPTSVL